MAVVEYNEMPRTGIWRFGESPDLTRRWVVTVDSPGSTTNAQVGQAIGVDIGSKHPEYRRVPCFEVELNEHYNENPYQIEFIARYNLREGDGESPNPLDRPAVWKFETMGQAVPALYYYDDNNARRPLTNSAFDLFEGLTTDEAYTRVTIRQNLPSFPSGLATALTNRINSDEYIFGNPGTWKCQGITGELRREVVLLDVVEYWETTATLMFRMSGWNLFLPDMGFNYISGQQKRRVMTFDPENAEFIPSPVPMGLNGNGAQTFGAPAILERRIYETAAFSTYFGNPPP